jgi:hypothetical protein
MRIHANINPFNPLFVSSAFADIRDGMRPIEITMNLLSKAAHGGMETNSWVTRVKPASGYWRRPRITLELNSPIS